MTDTDITQLLQQCNAGDRSALDRVFDLLYRELRRLAGQRVAQAGGAQTLTPTGLVHEAYLKLARASSLSLENRGHFLACAARAMRLVLTDLARQRGADKRGGEATRVALHENLAESAGPGIDVLDLERALDALDAVDPALRELAELRYFSGLSVEEIAALRGVTDRTVFRQWQQARAFLQLQLA